MILYDKGVKKRLMLQGKGYFDLTMSGHQGLSVIEVLKKLVTLITVAQKKYFYSALKNKLYLLIANKI